VRITERTVKQDKKKEKIVDELVEMDRRFIADFYKRTNQPKRNTVEKQVQSYLDTVENPTKISVDIDDNLVTQALVHDMDFDQIIAAVWS
jgi:hypothetical protein